jgi:hypothetical protein
MTRYKTIGSVAHNLGHSFLSDTNAVMRDGQYIIVPQLLFAAVARDRIREVTIDLVARRIKPQSLRSSEIQDAIDHYAEWLPKLLASHGASAAVVSSAILSLEFDHSRVRRTLYEPIQAIPEFSCVVELTDNRGVVHRGMPDHWWAV